jgi:hypothetical protein
MKYPTTLIIAALFCRTAVAAPEPVTCDSPCDCHNAHGEGRWSVKTDPSLPPTDASAIQAVTPSEMFSWLGPDAALTMQSERTGIENKWFPQERREGTKRILYPFSSRPTGESVAVIRVYDAAGEMIEMRVRFPLPAHSPICFGPHLFRTILSTLTVLQSLRPLF